LVTSSDLVSCSGSSSSTSNSSGISGDNSSSSSSGISGGSSSSRSGSSGGKCSALWIHLLVIVLFLEEFTAEKSSAPYHKWDNTTRSFLSHTIQIPDASEPVGLYKSWSQVKQDEIVLNFTKYRNNGFYVDLATNHYMWGSNTYNLDVVNNWKGVCIEANSEYYVGILGSRSCQLFGSPVGPVLGGEVLFRLGRRGEGGLGGIVSKDFDNNKMNADGTKEQTMVTATLEAVLDFANAPRVIQYLSFDIEGAEFFAMKEFNFSRYIFNLVTVERPNRKLHFLFTEAGYRFVYVMSDFGEVLYVHHTYEMFAHIMKQYQGQTMQGWNETIDHETLSSGKTHNYLYHPKVSATFVPWIRHHSKNVNRINVTKT
jgi:hypothetical protein